MDAGRGPKLALAGLSDLYDTDARSTVAGGYAHGGYFGVARCAGGAAHRCPCLKGRGAADADAGRRRHLGSHTRKRDADSGDAPGRRIEYWFSGWRYGDEVTRYS
ncbi:unnamed protein product [Urochloa humidicola]